jgi:hypothetical protein
MRQTVHGILLTAPRLWSMQQAVSVRVASAGRNRGSEPRRRPDSGFAYQRVMIAAKTTAQIIEARELVRPYFIESAGLEPSIALVQEESQRFLWRGNLQAEDLRSPLNRPLG